MNHFQSPEEQEDSRKEGVFVTLAIVAGIVALFPVATLSSLVTGGVVLGAFMIFIQILTDDNYGLLLALEDVYNNADMLFAIPIFLGCVMVYRQLFAFWKKPDKETE